MCTKYIMVIDVVVVARQLTTYRLVCFDSNITNDKQNLHHVLLTGFTPRHISTDAKAYCQSCYSRVNANI